MYCPNCGKNNKPNAKFCAKCGKKLDNKNNENLNGNNASTGENAVVSSKDSGFSIGLKKIVIIAIIVMVLIVAVGASLYNSTQSDNATNEDTYEYHHKNSPVMKNNHVSNSKDKADNVSEGEIHEVTESSNVGGSVDNGVVGKIDGETNSSEINDEFLPAGDPSMENEEISSNPLEINSLSIEETSVGTFHVTGSGILNRGGSYTLVARIFDAEGNAFDNDEVVWASDDEYIAEGESFTINGEIVTDVEISAIELYVVNQHIPTNGNYVAGSVDLTKSIYQERFNVS